MLDKNNMPIMNSEKVKLEWVASYHTGHLK